jgi:(2R)-3-sulfolactate dehydrogenase (NADP+)
MILNRPNKKTLMSNEIALSPLEIASLSQRALVAHGASEFQAKSVADAIAAAESEGIRSHGLQYLPTYCEHLHCGKVAGKTEPSLERTAPGVLRVDAQCGFAHPAIDRGLPELIALARVQGVALLSIHNSYNCGVLGYHTERIANAGCVALGFTNAPASIAPWGGKKPVLGTNPFSLAVPGAKGEARFVIDQSASVIAKSEVIRRRKAKQPIPEGWALDANGEPTTDPERGLQGSMVPAGGYKGTGVALLVEVMAACLSGATPGAVASPFSGPDGGPPRTGQLFIAIDPQVTSGGLFGARLDTVLDAFLAEPGVRLPGDKRKNSRRQSASGILVNRDVYEQVRKLGEGR